MVITLARDLTLTILQAQGIRSGLNCLDKGFRLRNCKFTAFKLLVYGLNRSPRKPATIPLRLRIAFRGISLWNALESSDADFSHFDDKKYIWLFSNMAIR